MGTPWPKYVNKGTFASSVTANTTVTPPTGRLGGDLLILAVATENSPIVLAANASLWTQVPTVSPQFTGTANTAGGIRLGVFYRWCPDTNQGAVGIADTGGSQAGIMIAIRGVQNSASFINASAGYSRAATANIACPEVTTTEPYCYILNIIGLDKDLADTDTITAWFPPTGSANSREIHDQSISTGAGSGIAIYGYEQQQPGPTGNTFGTGDTSTTRSYITLALKSDRKNAFRRRAITVV